MHGDNQNLVVYLANTSMNFENHCDNNSSFVLICNNYLTMV
jgi:hypothetical protein